MCRTDTALALLAFWEVFSASVVCVCGGECLTLVLILYVHHLCVVCIRPDMGRYIFGMINDIFWVGYIAGTISRRSDGICASP